MDNKYTYISSLIHPITNPLIRAVLIKDLLSGRPRSYLASPNAVVLDEEQGKLYTWTGERWDDFYPDQFTDYYGPNPHVKYIGETVTDIVNKPKNRSVEIRHTDHRDSYFIVHYALIGDVVTYNGAEYIYTGENNGWKIRNEISQPNEKKKFHYIGLTPYMPYDGNSTVKLMPAGMAGVIACSKYELTTYNASVLDVVQHCGRLYTFTAQKHWIQFVPGPCNDYDGPNPYDKKILISSAPSIDTPLAKLIREQGDTLKDLLRNNNVKYIGETDVNIRYMPNCRHINLKRIDMLASTFNEGYYAQVGDVVTYKGVEYIYTGINDGWKAFSETSQPNNKEENTMALEFRYLGTAQNALHDGAKGRSVFIRDRWESARNRDLVLKDDSLYCFIEDKNEWKKITSFEFDKTVKYSSIPYGFMVINKVVFNDPATIVFWKDGSKTIVKCGENESFDPEKGLAMAITKKAFGNQGNYYNQIKKWLPEPKEDDDEALTITERLNKIFGDPRIADVKKKLAAVQELICDMTFHGATKAELVRAIRFSKDLIDFSKGADIDITESVSKNGIIELEAKYQPK